MAKRSLLDDELLMIPVKYVVFFTTGLPFAAVIICVLLSVFIASHYQQVRSIIKKSKFIEIIEAVQTHCDVYNWYISIFMLSTKKRALCCVKTSFRDLTS